MLHKGFFTWSQHTLSALSTTSLSCLYARTNRAEIVSGRNVTLSGQCLSFQTTHSMHILRPLENSSNYGHCVHILWQTWHFTLYQLDKSVNGLPLCTPWVEYVCTWTVAYYELLPSLLRNGAEQTFYRPVTC